MIDPTHAGKQELVQETNIVPMNTPNDMLMVAVKQGSDPDVIAKFMDLVERHNSGLAIKAFNVAMMEFKKVCPIIKKDAKVKFGTTQYKHSSLEEIDNTIKDILHRFGLSYRYKNIYEGEREGLECIITHVDGHSESTPLFAPADASGGKNDIQAIGSRNTYLQRYSLIAALGLVTADEDDDGVNSGEIPYFKLVKHNEALRENLAVVDMIKQALNEQDYQTSVECIYEMGQEVYDALWVAPSKGGIFTTEQLKILKSDDYGVVVKEFYINKNTSV